MKKESNIPDYPKKEKGYFMDEQKFSRFSNNIFQFPIFGYLCGIYFNIIFFYCWRRKIGIISMTINYIFYYLIIEIILGKMLNTNVEK